MQKIADAAQYLEEGLVRLYNKANDRQNIVFQYNTTTATEIQVAEWIAEITRNPENSVRSHARRLTEWIRRLEYELMLDLRLDNPVDGYKLPDGSSYPDCQQINRTLKQEEVRDQRIMHGENWDETYQAPWRDGTRGPVHADTHTPVRVPAAFGVPAPRPLPGPNDRTEVIELETDQPRVVIDLTADSPGDPMEID
ncbi:hypothetical protein KCU91_g117, partial [Aureobasidium melanogenum]